MALSDLPEKVFGLIANVERLQADIRDLSSDVRDLICAIA